MSGKKPPKLYVLRMRHPDGSWTWDMETTMSKKEAERCSQINRIIAGTLCQVWSEDEAHAAISKAESRT